MKAELDPIRFGTSGWRGRIADTYTFANVRRLTRAIADHLKEAGEAERGVVVGYDTRFLSEDFAAAAAGTLAQAGLRCRLAVAPVPTPTVAHAVLHHRAAAGITITASHNPAPDNGLKLSGPTGGPALPEVTRAIEARVAASLDDPGGMPIGEARAAGLVESADFAPGVPRPVPASDRPGRDSPGPAARGRRRDARSRARLPRPPSGGGGLRGHAAPRDPRRHVRRPPAGAGGGAPPAS